jgi:hypothetical protein
MFLGAKFGFRKAWLPQVATMVLLLVMVGLRQILKGMPLC